MDKILEMKKKRADLIKKMRGLVTNAETEERTLNADEKTEYENLRAKATDLADEIVREEELRSLEDAMPPTENTPGAIQEEESLEAGVRTARFIKVTLLAARRHENPAELAERMYPQDSRLRAVMNEGVAEDGGVTVPQNLYSEVIPLLRQASITRSLGVTTLPLPNGNLNLIKQNGAANFTWVGENKPIGNSKIGMGSIKLSAKKLAGIIPISNELLADSSIVADSFVRNEIVAGIAEAEDITSLYGSGSANEPKGVTVACANNKIAVDGELTADVIYQMVGKIVSVKLNNPNPVWRIPGALWSKLYGMQNKDGNYVFRDEMKDGKLCGYQFKIDNNIKIGGDANGKTSIILGDWKHFVIGTASALKISVSTDASYTENDKQVSAFENDLTLMRALIREDFGVRYNEAFVWADGIFTKAGV